MYISFPLMFSTDNMLYLPSLQVISIFVVIFKFGIFLNLNNTVASENEAILAHIRLPCLLSLYARMLAKIVSFLLENPSGSITFSAEMISIKLFIFPNDTISLPSLALSNVQFTIYSVQLRFATSWHYI